MNTLYTLLVGWWLALAWMCLAIVFCCTIVGIPVGMAMFHKTPEILFGEV